MVTFPHIAISRRALTVHDVSASRRLLQPRLLVGRRCIRRRVGLSHGRRRVSQPPPQVPGERARYLLRLCDSGLPGGSGHAGAGTPGHRQESGEQDERAGDCGGRRILCQLHVSSRPSSSDGQARYHRQTLRFVLLLALSVGPHLGNLASSAERALCAPIFVNLGGCFAGAVNCDFGWKRP